MKPIFVLLLSLTACESTIQGDVGAPRYRSGQPAPIDDRNELPAYIAQCEAVLGPIPLISCDPANPSPGTHVTKIPVLVDGRPLALADEAVDAELLAARAQSGQYTCEFPSIGGDFPCAVGSTLVQYSDPTTPWIQWIGLCRGLPEDVPSYDRWIGNGLIGANEKTGEMCFFFGLNPEPEAPYVLPQLRSDVEPSELAPWLAPREMPGSCLSCHPNNDPWIMTPWLGPEYMGAVLADPSYGLQLPEGVAFDELLAARHVRQTPTAIKSTLPTPLPAGRTAWTEEEIAELGLRQYRAVGSSYVAHESEGTVQPRTGIRPASWALGFRERLLLQPLEQSCATGCHALANEHIGPLGDDALGKKYSHYVSESMHEGVAGFTWMPPGGGDAARWRDRFENAAASIPAITECPIPHRLHDSDVEVVCADGMAQISWVYDNDYGDVPARDDVRFDVALSVEDGAAERGIAREGAEGIRMDRDDGVTVLRNVQAHNSTYTIEIPYESPQVPWAVDIQPKRFCFEEPDRRPRTYAIPTRMIIEC